MDFQLILNQYVLPSAGILLMAIVSWGVKELVAWLKEKKAAATTERKKTLFGLAISAVEEVNHNIEKSGGAKMPSQEKEAVFLTKLTELAKNEKMTITESDIDVMLKAVLGETRDK